MCLQNCLHQAQLGSTLSLKWFLETINIKTPIFCTNNLGRIHRKKTSPKLLASYPWSQPSEVLCNVCFFPIDRSLAFREALLCIRNLHLDSSADKKYPHIPPTGKLGKSSSNMPVSGGYISFWGGYSTSMNHGSGKWLYLKGEGTILTFISFMILGGRVPTDQG